jgi:uncharacterized membrane protein YeaQ/YmgE (transglycosylase-associated protein family)
MANGGDFLPWMGSLNTSQMGLFNGSLYDVLADPYQGTNPGTAQVSAVGFNITCGSMAGIVVEEFGGSYNISSASESLIFDVSGAVVVLFYTHIINSLPTQRSMPYR